MAYVTERVLAAELGLSRDDLAELRKGHLQEGVDFQVVKKEVALAPAAVARLRAILGCADPEIEKNGHDGPPGARIEPILMVVKRGARNINILICEKKDAPGIEVRVRVRSNANFLPGMEIKATPHPEYDDFFDLAGRCPRQRGRW